MIRDKCSVYQVFTNRRAQIRIGNLPEKPPKRFANRILTARRYRSLLDGDDTLNQARLAKQEGVNRARVSQILNLVELDQDVQDFVCGLDATDLRLKVLTERRLRGLLKMRLEDQKLAFYALVIRVRGSLFR